MASADDLLLRKGRANFQVFGCVVEARDMVVPMDTSKKFDKVIVLCSIPVKAFGNKFCIRCRTLYEGLVCEQKLNNLSATDNESSFNTRNFPF